MLLWYQQSEFVSSNEKTRVYFDNIATVSLKLVYEHGSASLITCEFIQIGTMENNNNGDDDQEEEHSSSHFSLFDLPNLFNHENFSWNPIGYPCLLLFHYHIRLLYYFKAY